MVSSQDRNDFSSAPELVKLDDLIHYSGRISTPHICFNADCKMGPNPSELSPRAAFRFLPIAQQYDFGPIRSWCEEAFHRSQLDLWPSDPIASSEVLNHPGLVQCLALADAKQCDSMVQSCLSKLIKPGSVYSHDTVFDALASPHHDTLIDGLRSQTKSEIIRRMAGLPEGFKAGLKLERILFSVWAKSWL